MLNQVMLKLQNAIKHNLKAAIAAFNGRFAQPNNDLYFS